MTDNSFFRDIPVAQLDVGERAKLTTSLFLCAAAHACGFTVIEPQHEGYFRTHHGYSGDDQKQLAIRKTGEIELFSLAYATLDNDQAPAHLRYCGSLVLTNDSPSGQLVYRAVGGNTAPNLEGVYRRERYGRLLKDHKPLPTDHLLSFEGPLSLAELSWREVDTSTPQPNSARQQKKTAQTLGESK